MATRMNKIRNKKYFSATSAVICQQLLPNVNIKVYTSHTHEIQAEINKMKANKNKRKAWTNDDELKLLKIWGINQSELRQTKRNAHIYARMSKAMGGKFTPNEVHIKISNLTQRYRSEKKELATSGESSSKWALFDSVKKIFEINPANTLASVESFSFFSTNTKSNKLLNPLLVSSSPLPPSRSEFNTKIEQSSSQSSYSLDQGLMNGMNESKKQQIKLESPSIKISRKKWTHDDELDLLQKWANESELRQVKRNAHIYARMSKEMGGKFTPHEVHIKISNLIQRYRAEKKDVGTSGGSSSKWAHFDAVHKIIGGNDRVNNASVESFEFFATNTNSNELLTPMSVSQPSPLPTSLPFSPSPVLEQSSSGSSDSFHQELMNSLNELKKQGEKQLNVFKNVATAAKSLSENLANYMKSQQENEKIFLECFKKLAEKDEVRAVNEPLKKRRK